jgi:hypothetical protein
MAAWRMIDFRPLISEIASQPTSAVHACSFTLHAALGE